MHPIKWLCNHLVGKHHTLRHRILFGIVFILIGVYVAHCAHHFNNVLAFVVDGVGYLIHGIGAIPFVEATIALVSTEE